MLVIRDGTVVDVDGARQADVAVEEGEVVEVGDVSGGDRTVDAEGAYVAPALIDSHVHLAFDARPDSSGYRDDSVAADAYRAAANCRTLAEAGVGAVRDLGAPATVALDARDAVADGTLRGPRVRAAGQNVVMTGGHGHWFGREADGPDEVRKAVREQLKAGADVVKCMATGGVLTEGAEVGAPELTPAELEALVETAHDAGVPTAAHAHGTEGIKNAVRAGIDSVEHGTFMDREAAEMMAERGTRWVPTAKALHGIVEAGTEGGIPEFAVRKAERAAEAFEDAFDHVTAAGVEVAMGTDAGTPFNRVADVPEELSLMVEHGLAAETAFEAATAGSADLLGLDDAGRVSAGARADVVVLPADPREEPSAYGSPETVLVDGEVVA
jgi:imidazolonepropionase-like amidohydrolase